jgi:transposase
MLEPIQRSIDEGKQPSDTWDLEGVKILSDEEWEILKPLFPEQENRSRGRSATPVRAVINSLIYIIRNRMKWHTIPQDGHKSTKTRVFSSATAANQKFLEWRENGTLEKILDTLGIEPSERQYPPTRHRLSKEEKKKNPSDE